MLRGMQTCMFIMGLAIEHCEGANKVKNVWPNLFCGTVIVTVMQFFLFGII